MDRVAMPRLEKRISPPFSPDEIQDLLLACDRSSVPGTRNYAIVLTLLDTGLRAAECVSLRVADVNMRSGPTTLLGNGRKQRTVRIGSKARGAILRMLAFRRGGHGNDPLWAKGGPQGRVDGGAHSIYGQIHVLPQHLAVQEKDRAERLILR